MLSKWLTTITFALLAAATMLACHAHAGAGIG